MEIASALIQAAPSIEQVYREHAARLWRSVFAFAGDADIASDSVAEAFAQAMHRGAAVRDPAAWAWRAAFRIAAGALKTRNSGSSAMHAPREQIDRYADPDLLAALRRLPDGQRAAVVLFLLRGPFRA